jgi:Flp pilus assembly protein TadB
MLDTAAGKATGPTAARHAARNKNSLISRRIWLPKLLYDALPYFYLASGLAAFFATLYITEWFWVLPHYLLFSLVCIHLGVIVYRRRHRSLKQQREATD